MAFQVTPSRNYAVKYFDFRILSNSISRKHFTECKCLFVWFGLTKHASFLVNFDRRRGLRNPFCGPKSLAAQCVKSQTARCCLSIIDSFRRAVQLSWRVTHTVGEAWQGARAWTRAAKRPLFHPPGGQDPTPTWLRVVMRAKEATHSQELCRPHHSLTLADTGEGEEGRKGGHHSSDL